MYLGAEQREVGEARDVERKHEVPEIARLVEFAVHLGHMPAERHAGQMGAQDLDHQRERVALMAAGWREADDLVCIGRRLAVRIDAPVGRDGFCLLYTSPSPRDS